MKKKNLIKHIYELNQEIFKLRNSIIDKDEALYRSRNLRKSFQEYAERTNQENISIENISENLFDFCKLWFVPREWEYSELSESDKNFFREKATKIISNATN